MVKQAGQDVDSNLAQKPFHFTHSPICGCSSLPTSCVSEMTGKQGGCNMGTGKTDRAWDLSDRPGSHTPGLDLMEGPWRLREEALMRVDILPKTVSRDELHSPSQHSMIRDCGFRQCLAPRATTKTVSVAMIAVLLLLVTPGAFAFNVDLEKPVVQVGPPGSMFGYSVAQHIDQSTNWLLIGAPKAQTSQPNVEKAGAVFRCKATSSAVCQRVPFDSEGNMRRYIPARNRSVPIEEKSNQWLGATIRSSGENGVIVACAPRYVYFSELLNKREPVGTCYLAKSSTTQIETLSPCKQGKSGFNHQGFCQAGVSAALSKDGTRLMIGAPGSFYWQGQLFQVDVRRGRTLRRSQEDSPETDYGYMGYASAIGEFDGNPDDEYVVGIPKGANSTGMVEIYTQNFTVIGTFKGEQIGSYFGSSLEVMDLNGDNLDDIVVGAPFFGDTSSDEYETGRVYIYYQTKKRKFNEPKKDILDGFSSQSRFGMAIGRVGDINYDGNEDLCVGAPYAGEDKRGAIYLYHGSDKGIITNPTQIIFAKDIDPTLSALGSAISGGWDQDDNGYPDFLVGAYSSDRAVFLRTRPVVKVSTSLNTVKAIDLKVRRCNDFEKNAEKSPCLTINTCYVFSGHRLPGYLDLDFTWTLDEKMDNTTRLQEQRVFLFNSVNQYVLKKTIAVKKDMNNCTTIHAYVKNDLIDKLTPIKIKLDFKLNEERFRQRGLGDLVPILNAYTPKETSRTVEIKNNCGDDKICYPDLYISAFRITNMHVIGTTRTLDMHVQVENHGEDSFNTKVWVDLPPGVVYSSIPTANSDTPISCGTLGSNNKKVVCDVGNPMISETKLNFTLQVTPTNTNDTQSRLVFLLAANSSNPERTFRDFENNIANVSIPVTAVPEISLDNKANPEYIVLNTTKKAMDGQGRLVSQGFQLKNQGNCAINETQLQVLWPSKDKDGNPLLTLEGSLVIEGNGKCNITVITPENAMLYKDLWWKQGGSKSGPRDNEDLLNSDKTSAVKIDCSKTGDYCTVIQCLVGYTAPGGVFDLTVLSRLKPHNFLKNREKHQMYAITSVASAKVLSVPYDFKSVDTSKFMEITREAKTTVHTDRLKPASKGVKVWIIALAVTAGVLLLVLLILLLWFCGFFKRKRHEPEGYSAIHNGKSYIDDKIVD